MNASVLHLPHVKVLPEHIAPSTRKRYLVPQLSWKRHCDVVAEDALDASDQTLIDWLGEHVKSRNACNVALSALRYLQRRELAERGIISTPYSASARPRLEAWVRMRWGTKRGDSAQAKPLMLDDLSKAVRACGFNSLPRSGVSLERAQYLTVRDTALLLLGWWGAFRADDLSRLDWADIRDVGRGLEIDVRRSKTGAAVVAIARAPRLCAWAAVRELRAVADRNAPPFPGPEGISRAVARRCRDARLAQRFTGHSLRSGFATEAASQGIDDRFVRRHGRWLSIAVHDTYVRAGKLWEETPTRMIRVDPEGPPPPEDPGG